MSLTFLATLQLGCNSDTPSSSSTTLGTEAAESKRALQPIPRPPLDRLEENAKAQIEAQQIAVDQGAVEGTEAWGNLGRLYWVYEFYAEAKLCFANAQQLAPTDPQWAYYLGITVERQGDFETAIAYLSRTLELQSGHLPSLLRLGRIALQQHDLPTAQRNFQQVLDASPSSAAALYGLGRVAEQRQDLPAAISYFERSLAEQPDAAAVHHSLGLAYRDVGKTDRALKHLEQSGSRRPRFEDPWVDAAKRLISGARIHLVQGGRESNAGRLEQALQHYKKAVEIDPQLPQAQHNLGATLGALGQHQGALEHLQRALELDPTLTDAHFDLAMAQHHLGRLDAAVEALDRVLGLDPGDRSARQRRAAFYHAQGRTSQAHSELLQLLVEDPQDSTSRLLLAPIEEALGNVEESMGLFKAVSLAEPDRLQAHLGVVRLTMGSEQFAVTKEHLQHALGRTSLSSSTRLSLQHLLARLLATCPDATVRDGASALALAQQVFQQAQSLTHGETVAMALAESARFAEAVQWQQQLLAQARQSAAPTPLLRRLEIELASYRRGEPIRAGG